MNEMNGWMKLMHGWCNEWMKSWMNDYLKKGWIDYRGGRDRRKEKNWSKKRRLG